MPSAVFHSLAVYHVSSAFQTSLRCPQCSPFPVSSWTCFVCPNRPGVSPVSWCLHRLLRLQHTLHLQQAEQLLRVSLDLPRYPAPFLEFLHDLHLPDIQDPQRPASASDEVPSAPRHSDPSVMFRGSRSFLALRSSSTPSLALRSLPCRSCLEHGFNTCVILRAPTVLCILRDGTVFDQPHCLATAFLRAPPCSPRSASPPASTPS